MIHNLKEKIKQLNERITEQQKSMMDVLIDKELKEKEAHLNEKRNGIDARNEYQYFDENPDNSRSKPRNKLGE